MYPYFEVFGRSIGSYAVMSFMGLFAAAIVARRLASSLKIAFEDVVLMMISVGVGMLIGGHLLYALTDCEKMIGYAGEIFRRLREGTLSFSYVVAAAQSCFGGMVFYGGFFGAVAALRLHMHLTKAEYKKEMTDIFAVCVPLFHGFGRIGCFLGGCCYGKESSIGFIAYNELIPEMSGVRRFPIALVESAFCFLLFWILLRRFRKTEESGRLLYHYLLLYSIGRFVLEFFRGDAVRGIFFSLSTSQWISIPLFVIGLIGCICEYRRRTALRAET